jgi:hypothetical protein
LSETAFKARFAEHGYWQPEEGMLVNGRNQDLLLYSLLREDPRPWHAPGSDGGNGPSVA